MILGSPVAGIAADEIIDPTPAITEIVDRFIGDPELTNLPRKFKSAITGHPSLDVVHEINDVSLVGVVHPEFGPGYDLWVGGGLSTAPRLAERLGIALAVEIVFALTVMACRMILGAHFLSDVSVGAFVSVAAFFVVMALHARK